MIRLDYYDLVLLFLGILVSMFGIFAYLNGLRNNVEADRKNYGKMESAELFLREKEKYNTKQYYVLFVLSLTSVLSIFLTFFREGTIGSNESHKVNMLLKQNDSMKTIIKENSLLIDYMRDSILRGQLKNESN